MNRENFFNIVDDGFCKRCNDCEQSEYKTPCRGSANESALKDTYVAQENEIRVLRRALELFSPHTYFTIGKDAELKRCIDKARKEIEGC